MADTSLLSLRPIADQQQRSHAVQMTAPEARRSKLTRNAAPRSIAQRQHNAQHVVPRTVFTCLRRGILRAGAHYPQGEPSYFQYVP